MLTEIACDRFKDGYKVIKIKKGLNIVLGTEKASNSIGKSTFLMIVDFVFGGNDYVDLLADVQDNVGAHEIKFKFEFGKNDIHRFARKTNEPNWVYICIGEDYRNTGIKRKLSDYLTFLENKYGIRNTNQTFRNTVSRFVRVYPRDTMDRKRPISEYRSQKDSEAIDHFLSLFGKHDTLVSLKDEKERLGKESDALKNARKYKYLPTYDGEGSIDDEIKDLKKKRTDIVNETSIDVAKQYTKNDRIVELEFEVAKLKETRSSLSYSMRGVQRQTNDKKIMTQGDIAALKQFFPDANFQLLSDIENFHKKISKILKKDIFEYQERLQTEISVVDKAISEVESEIQKLAKEENLDSFVLSEFARIENRLTLLEQIKEQQKQEEDLKTEKKEAKEKYETELKSLIQHIEDELNKEMFRINSTLFVKLKTSPEISFGNGSKYIFKNTKDGGSACAYRGLIVFDLAVSRITKLPVIVHDSDMLKLIEDDVFRNILKEYEKSESQIFISIDKISAYTDETQGIINDRKILKLGEEKESLFGMTWNTVT